MWNPEKAAGNRLKHGVSFEMATRVFDDSLALTHPNPHPQEERWHTPGRPVSTSPLLLFVVHTWPDDEAEAGRIISARRADPKERKIYEEG